MFYQGQVSVLSLGGCGLLPRLVIPKTIKMVLIASLLGSQDSGFNSCGNQLTLIFKIIIGTAVEMQNWLYSLTTVVIFFFFFFNSSFALSVKQMKSREPARTGARRAIQLCTSFRGKNGSAPGANMYRWMHVCLLCVHTC